MSVIRVNLSFIELIREEPTAIVSKLFFSLSSSCHFFRFLVVCSVFDALIVLLYNVVVTVVTSVTTDF